MIRLEGYDKGFSKRWDCQPSVIVDGDTAANTYMLRQQQQADIPSSVPTGVPRLH